MLGFFTLPAILEGSSPVAVAIVSSATILFVVLYLAHGVSMRTSSALLGTLVSLFVAGALSALAISTMKLTGLSGDQTMNLQVYQGNISISGVAAGRFHHQGRSVYSMMSRSPRRRPRSNWPPRVSRRGWRRSGRRCGWAATISPAPCTR